MFSKKHLFMCSVASLLCIPSLASAITLSNGTGDGTVTVGVDGFGSFGSSVGGDGTSDAFYNPVGEIPFNGGFDEEFEGDFELEIPVGDIGSAGTTFESAIAVDFGGTQSFLTTGDIGGFVSPTMDVTILDVTGTSVTSTFEVGFLNFTLNQSITESFNDAGEQVGSVLNQVYTIQNTASVNNSFDVVRYLDGDLDFDGSISDGGGQIFTAGNRILFETDSASGSDESTTFVGITANGGVEPATNRFQVSEFSGLRSNIANNIPLADFIQNDTDGDGFIDEAFDVTLALRNEFNLAPNAVGTFTTQTLFGNAVPPVPGSIEALPLLPNDITPDGAFEFVLNGDDIVPGETIFFDPDIAIGYTYQVTGAEFDSVTAPTFAAVADPDGYLVEFTFGLTDFSIALASGDTLDFGAFGTGLTEFTLLGIDPALGLDPTNPTAFVTGISFENVASAPSVVTLSQTPISVPSGPTVAPIPLPPALALFASGLFGLALFGRRKKTA